MFLAVILAGFLWNWNLLLGSFYFNLLIKLLFFLSFLAVLLGHRVVSQSIRFLCSARNTKIHKRQTRILLLQTITMYAF